MVCRWPAGEPAAVYRPDAFEDLAHDAGLGRVGKALIAMPAGQRRQPMPQGVVGQTRCMVSQVTGNRFTGRGQQALPFDFKVLYSRCIAAPGIGALRSLDEFINAAH